MSLSIQPEEGGAYTILFSTVHLTSQDPRPGVPAFTFELSQRDEHYRAELVGRPHQYAMGPKVALVPLRACSRPLPKGLDVCDFI